VKAKYKVGDTVAVNERYLNEGARYFGKELKHKTLKGKIVKVFENTNDERDGSGDIWQTFYEVTGSIHICECFLKAA